jgi:ribosomal protein S18 acetylase RimI-like enzyme
MHRFELSPELVTDIAFAMENQSSLSVMDCLEGNVVDTDSIDSQDDSRYMPLPEWLPADGFRIMEMFTARVRVPELQNTLRKVLQQGKGVFRAFKDSIQAYPEQEQAWYLFKERQIRRRISEWYNELRELWGLEQVALEHEIHDTALVLSDFNILQAEAKHAAGIRELDRRGFEEQWPILSSEGQAIMYRRFRSVLPSPLDHEQGSRTLVIEAIDGSRVGFCWGVLTDPGDGPIFCHIQNLVIDMPYRGAGLATALEAKFRNELIAEGCSKFLGLCSSGSNGFFRQLEELGYQSLLSFFWR